MDTNLEHRSQNLTTLTIVVTPEDYLTEADKKLKKLAKTVSLKGFRPGKAPLPLVNKMVGQNVKEEALYDLMQQEVSKFMSNTDLNIFFRPIPTGDSITKDKIDANQTFTFSFDFFTCADIDCSDLLSKVKVNQYKIISSPEQFNEFKANFVKYANTYNDTDTIDQNSYFQADIEYKGTTKRQWFSIERDIKPEFHALFIGKKNSEIVESALRPLLVEENIPLLLGEKIEVDDHIAKFSIIRIQSLSVPTGVDLYLALFPNHNIADEDAFNEQVQREFELNLNRRTEFLSRLKFERDLLEAYPIIFDEDNFERFYSFFQSEEKQQPDSIEKKTSEIQKGINLSLIAQSISKHFDIDATFDEAVDFETSKFISRIGNTVNFHTVRDYVANNLREDASKLNSIRNQLLISKAPFDLAFERQEVEIHNSEYESLQAELQK